MDIRVIPLGEIICTKEFRGVVASRTPSPEDSRGSPSVIWIEVNPWDEGGGMGMLGVFIMGSLCCWIVLLREVSTIGVIGW